MPVSITAVPDNPTAIVSAINLNVVLAPSNTDSGYDPDEYPASPEVRYYISVEKAGEDSLVSEVFSTNPDGTHQWASVIIPATGTWTAHLRNAATDASVTTDTITAS